MKKYIRSETELSEAMQQMIENIAREWIVDMHYQECETFKEFISLNDYDASDIRAELRYMIQNHYDGWMYDDGTIVIASDDTEMPYGKFKKAVIDKINELV